MGSWPFRQIEKYLNSFEENLAVFRQVIFTDDLTEKQVCSKLLG